MDPAALTAALKEESFRLGFDLAGATLAVAPPDFERLQQWLADGCAGEMRYLGERLDAYRHPAQILDGVKSILMLATNYRTVEPIEPGEGQAKVSRCAWGQDYHEIVRERLHKLADFHRTLTPTAQVRGVVDTAPLLEKQFAQLAGLGWIGKHTLLINRRFGSWIVLAALLTTEELAYDEPCTVDHCGSCRACIDACPTGALEAAFRIDARKCISYLTIECSNPPPNNNSSLPFGEGQGGRAACGNRLYGCDACQEACPWNRDTPSTTEPAFFPNPGMNPVELAELLALDEDAFRQRFRHTPLWRARHNDILRKTKPKE
jgi:epoxyqueuosine reductase